MKDQEDNQIPIDKIVSILLDSDQPENGLKFLKLQFLKHANGSSYLKLMKTSINSKDFLFLKLR